MERFSFLKSRLWQDVYLGELGPDCATMKPPRRFTLDNRGSDPSSWTGDSQAILFSSDRNGRSEIFRQGLNQGVGEAIEGADGDCCVVPSPDGSWMLYEEWAPNTPSTPHRLMRRSAAGGSPEIVLEQPADVLWDHRCPLKPGSQCVLAQQEGKDRVFYSLDPVRGERGAVGEDAG